MKRWILSLGLIAALVTHIPARAAAGVGPSGLISPNYHVTFSEIVLPIGTVVETQFSPFGVSFSTSTIMEFSESDWRYDVQGSVGGCASIPGGGDSCFGGLNAHTIGSAGGNPVFIQFSAVQREAAFGLASNPRQFTITALRNGQLVDSYTIMMNGGGYYGFTNSEFDTIEIRGVLQNKFDNRVLLDNIQFNNLAAPVPEPSLLTLMLLGVVVLVVRGWVVRARGNPCHSALTA